MNARTKLFAVCLMVASPAVAQEGRMVGPEAMPDPNRPVEPMRVMIQMSTEETSWEGGRSQTSGMETMMRDSRGRVRRDRADGTVELLLPGKMPITLDPSRNRVTDPNKPKKAKKPKKMSPAEMETERQFRALAEKHFRENPKPALNGGTQRVKEHVKLPDQSIRGHMCEGARQVTEQVLPDGYVIERTDEAWRDKQTHLTLRKVTSRSFDRELKIGNGDWTTKTKTSTTDYIYVDPGEMPAGLFEVPAGYVSE